MTTKQHTTTPSRGLLAQIVGLTILTITGANTSLAMDRNEVAAYFAGADWREDQVAPLLVAAYQRVPGPAPDVRFAPASTDPRFVTGAYYDATANRINIAQSNRSTELDHLLFELANAAHGPLYRSHDRAFNRGLLLPTAYGAALADTELLATYTYARLTLLAESLGLTLSPQARKTRTWLLGLGFDQALTTTVTPATMNRFRTSPHGGAAARPGSVEALATQDFYTLQKLRSLRDSHVSRLLKKALGQVSGFWEFRDAIAGRYRGAEQDPARIYLEVLALAQAHWPDKHHLIAPLWPTPTLMAYLAPTSTETSPFRD